MSTLTLWDYKVKATSHRPAITAASHTRWRWSADRSCTNSPDKVSHSPFRNACKMYRKCTFKFYSMLPKWGRNLKSTLHLKLWLGHIHALSNFCLALIKKKNGNKKKITNFQIFGFSAPFFKTGVKEQKTLHIFVWLCTTEKVWRCSDFHQTFSDGKKADGRKSDCALRRKDSIKT